MSICCETWRRADALCRIESGTPEHGAGLSAHLSLARLLRRTLGEAPGVFCFSGTPAVPDPKQHSPHPAADRTQGAAQREPARGKPRPRQEDQSMKDCLPRNSTSSRGTDPHIQHTCNQALITPADTARLFCTRRPTRTSLQDFFCFSGFSPVNRSCGAAFASEGILTALKLRGTGTHPHGNQDLSRLLCWAQDA